MNKSCELHSDCSSVANRGKSTLSAVLKYCWAGWLVGFAQQMRMTEAGKAISAMKQRIKSFGRILDTCRQSVTAKS